MLLNCSVDYAIEILLPCLQFMGEYKGYMDTKTDIRLRRRARQKGLSLPGEDEEGETLEAEDRQSGASDAAAGEEDQDPSVGGRDAADARGGWRAAAVSSTSGRAWGQSFAAGRRVKAGAGPAVSERASGGDEAPGPSARARQIAST